MFGAYSGQKSERSGNIYAGAYSGQKNITADNGIFLGAYSGWENTNNKPGGYNIYAGAYSGWKTAKGHYEHNTFLGAYSGRQNITGSNNIFIGQGVMDNLPKSSKISDTFIVGNKSNPKWIEGEIGTDTFKVNSKQVSYSDHTHSPSSKSLKKNIKPFQNFKKALQDILKTPLFTFQLKEDPLKKNRMGVISEELPSHLQVKEKNKPSHPDWTSIYGTFWGAIKALHKLFMEFKEEHQEKHESLISENNGLFMECKKESEESRKSLSQENNKLKTEIERLEGQIKDIKKEIEEKCGI